jgi:hypothetical protein
MAQKMKEGFYKCILKFNFTYISGSGYSSVSQKVEILKP